MRIMVERPEKSIRTVAEVADAIKREGHIWIHRVAAGGQMYSQELDAASLKNVEKGWYRPVGRSRDPLSVDSWRDCNVGCDNCYNDNYAFFSAADAVEYAAVLKTDPEHRRQHEQMLEMLRGRK